MVAATDRIGTVYSSKLHQLFCLHKMMPWSRTLHHGTTALSKYLQVSSTPSDPLWIWSYSHTTIGQCQHHGSAGSGFNCTTFQEKSNIYITLELIQSVEQIQSCMGCFVQLIISILLCAWSCLDSITIHLNFETEAAKYLCLHLLQIGVCFCGTPQGEQGFQALSLARGRRKILLNKNTNIEGHSGSTIP